MKQVKIFSAFDTDTLQYQVNEWLSANKNIEILESNMNAFPIVEGKGKPEKEKFTFYILFSNLPHPVTEVNAILEQSIPIAAKKGRDIDIEPQSN